LFEARVIVTAYNQHVRLLSPGLGWFAPSKSTRGWEPTLLWNHFTQMAREVPGADVRVAATSTGAENQGRRTRPRRVLNPFLAVRGIFRALPEEIVQESECLRAEFRLQS